MIDPFALARTLIRSHRAAEVDEEALSRALEHFDERPLAPGDVLMAEGQLADALHVLLDGEVAVSLGGRELTRLRAPVVLGELGVLAGLPRSATVTALAPGRQLVLAERELWSFVDGPSDAGAALRRLLLAAMADVLAKDNDRLTAAIPPVHPAPVVEPVDEPSDSFGFSDDILLQARGVQFVTDEANERRRYRHKK